MDALEITDKFYQAKTREDIAELLGIKEKSLRFFLYKERPDRLYRTFSIPKRNGDAREINSPSPKLKSIQRKLADVLTVVYSPKICAYGFIPGKTIVNNAEKHLKRKVILNIDLKDFFTQIHFGRVRGMFSKPPYSLGLEAATTLAQLSCYKGRLPQGAPSSPVITNMICAPLDNALMRIAKKYHCVYTRYADDITFSTYRDEFDASIVYLDGGKICLGEELLTALRKNSFEYNPQKVALRYHNQRQEVTGLTVNEFPNVRRSYIKNLRAILYSCEKYGVISAAEFYINKGLCSNPKICKIANDPKHSGIVRAWFKQVLRGKIDYIGQVKGYCSGTFYSFAKQINDIFQEEVFNLELYTDLENIANNWTYILESQDGKVQGSAFYLDKIGLLTSFHVTHAGDGDFFDGYTCESYGKEKKFVVGSELNEESADKDIDYAIYKVNKPSVQCKRLKIGESKTLKQGESVTIIGYPGYNRGDSPYIQTCTITGRSHSFGALFYRISGRVAHGASGGPVLNSQNEVIGIIKGGIESLDSVDQSNVQQGFVPIHLVVEHMKGNDINDRQDNPLN